MCEKIDLFLLAVVLGILMTACSINNTSSTNNTNNTNSTNSESNIPDSAVYRKRPEETDRRDEIIFKLTDHMDGAAALIFTETDIARNAIVTNVF
ncbi:MAG: hypothetical protein NC548_38080 [Lachnospiraceae bacterium]|nr:hypothetical protein [Lachnospiraceae bacterium]